jgi:hypothetical protein
MSRQHEEGQRTAEELQTGQHQPAGARCDHHELQGKIVNLIKQLHANERRLSESTREIQKIGHQNLKLQTEVANLKQQLKTSQAKQQQLLNQLQTTRSIENQDPLARIDSISHKLVARPETLDKLAMLEDVTNFQNQLQANNQEPQTEIATVKDPLPTGDYRFVDPANRNQHNAKCHAPPKTEPTRGAGQGEATRKEISQHLQERLARRDGNGKQAGPFEEHIDPLQKKEAPLLRNLQSSGKPAGRNSGERSRALGIVPSTAAIAIVGAMAIGFVRTRSDNGAAIMPQGPDQATAESPMTILETPAEPGIAEATETELRTTKFLEQTPLPTTSPSRLRGTFKMVRPAALFTGPSEESALIRTVAAGTKIDVIDSRDGWLEVRSVHGTSGFVRQEAAVRVSQDQS